MWFAVPLFAAIALLSAPLQAQTAATKSEAPPEVRSYSLRASDLMGKPVRNPKGERLGTIDDVVISGEDRTPFAVVALPAHGASGAKRVAVPFRSLVAAGHEAYVLEASADQLHAYPEYQWPRGTQGTADASSRDAYAASNRERLTEWEGKVGQFAEETKRKTEAGAAEASERINSAWGKVKDQWRTLSDATGEKWDGAKRSFEQSWQDFQREWSRSTK